MRTDGRRTDRPLAATLPAVAPIARLTRRALRIAFSLMSAKDQAAARQDPKFAPLWIQGAGHNKRKGLGITGGPLTMGGDTKLVGGRGTAVVGTGKPAGA